MRVITGTARGRRLKEPVGLETRPTADRVKEGIFSSIQFELEGRRVLDLFGGTGQMGIEALSRGAAHATFVDLRKDAVAVIRENLAKAEEYREKLERALEDEEEEKPEYDAKLEALLPVLRGELPVHIHAHRADDIVTGIRICKEFHLRYVIVHGTEGHLIPDLLAEEGAGVITGPCLGDRSKPELANQSLETPAILQRHGVKTAICTDHPETPIQYLPLCAAMAVRGGMDPESALACITIRAAELAGVAHRVGSLAPGKDADLTVTSSHPLNWLSRVRLVVMDGKVVVSSL